MAPLSPARLSRAPVLGKGLKPWYSVALGLAVICLGFAALALVRSVVLAASCTAFLGMAAPFVQVPMVTQLQRQVPTELMGRVFATFNTVSVAAVPLGSLLAGTALHAVEPPRVFLAAALGLLVLAAAVGLYRRFTATGLVPAAK